MNKILRISCWGILFALVMHPAFGGRAPEPVRDSLREPMQPAAHMIAGEANVLAEAPQSAPQALDTVLHSPKQTQASTAAAQAASRTQSIFAAVRHHTPPILGSLLGGLILLAGWIGYRHSKQIGMDAGRTQRSHRQRKPKPNKPQYLSKGWSIVIGIAILAMALGLSVLLGNLILGTLVTGFGIATLALVVATVLVAGMVIGAIAWAQAYSKNNRQGNSPMQRGCSEFFTFMALMFIIVPSALVIGALLTWGALALFLSFAVSFGTAILVFLVIAGVMTPTIYLAIQFLQGYV